MTSCYFCATSSHGSSLGTNPLGVAPYKSGAAYCNHPSLVLRPVPSNRQEMPGICSRAGKSPIQIHVVDWGAPAFSQNHRAAVFSTAILDNHPIFSPPKNRHLFFAWWLDGRRRVPLQVVLQLLLQVVGDGIGHQKVRQLTLRLSGRGAGFKMVKIRWV